MNKIIYVDMDNVLVDFQSGIDQLDDKTFNKYKGRFDEVPGIFKLMKPIENAIESFIELTKYYDVYILSTSPWDNPTALNDKLEWIKKHLEKFAYKKVIFSHHKNLNKGNYLIDDRLKNGADKFEGEHIHFGTKKYSNWESVLDYLIENRKKTTSKEKVFELLAEGGALTGYEIKDENDKIVGYSYQTNEYYDLDEDLLTNKQSEQFADFETLWLVVQEKYKGLYHFFPKFIKDEYQPIVRDILLDDFFNSKIELLNEEEWFNILDLDYNTLQITKKYYEKK